MATFPIPDPQPPLDVLRRARDRLIELADTELRLGRLRQANADPRLADRSFRLALAATDLARGLHRLIATRTEQCARKGSRGAAAPADRSASPSASTAEGAGAGTEARTASGTARVTPPATPTPPA